MSLKILSNWKLNYVYQSHTIFILDKSADSSTPSGALNNEIWYGNAKSIPNINDVIRNYADALTSQHNDKCLVLGSTLHESVPFVMRDNNCNEKKSFICMLKNPDQVSHQVYPSFPCIPMNDNVREKRNGGDGVNQVKNDRDEGTYLSIMTTS